uniref:RB112 n=1 Tax=Ruegeria sp. PR1b TaxID=185588 RepID=Q8KWD0_9RHOB|nr:WcbI family polysaccharide biosynthesis putative acetyltransferase [Ruegeria sp. PR1b]AAN05133.1 RB112 [Ruegeria sp. PR1b]
MTKKIFTVVGNCQAPFIADALRSNPAFAAEYSYQHTPAVHVIPKAEINGYLETMERVDLVIHQPILNADRFGRLETGQLRRRLAGKSALVCIPSCYFDGYFPTITMIAGLTTPAGGVHDMAVFHAFDLGWTVPQTVARLYQQDPLKPMFYRRAFARSLQGMQEREEQAGVDITLSDIFDTDGRSQIVMHQFNHPTGMLFNKIAARICAHLGLAETECVVPRELDTVVWPVWPWVRAALDLPEGGNDQLMVRGAPVAMETFVAGAFEAYATMQPAQRTACRGRMPRVREILAAL